MQREPVVRLLQQAHMQKVLGPMLPETTPTLKVHQPMLPVSTRMHRVMAHMQVARVSMYRANITELIALKHIFLVMVLLAAIEKIYTP